MKRLTRKRRFAALAMSSAAGLSLAGVAAIPQASSAATAGQGAASHGQQSSRYGGVLNMLGSGDVDYMDPNISYYTVGYDGLRMWTEELLNYPAVAGKTTTVVPQMATAMPSVTGNGTVYTLTIKKGVDWNTSPARQVTAADARLGLERTCNPYKPFGGMIDFEPLVVGMTAYCNGFAKVKPTVAAIKQYITTHTISGVTVSASNPLQISYHLTHAVTYFPDLLAMAAFTPAPVEDLDYLPASAQFAAHTISDGPYEIQSYTPGRSMVLVRNPVWKASLDPISKAYVDEIKINETTSAQSVQQQLQTNTSSADLEWGDTPVPPAPLAQLAASASPNLVIGPTDGMDPYVEFNTVDPNASKALQNVNVRRAISYAINRAQLVTDAGGPKLSPPLSQMLPPGSIGYSNFDLYPYNPTLAKKLLGGKHYTFKFLYQSDNAIQPKLFQAIQSQLSQVGITLTGEGVPQADIYTKYYYVPSDAKTGVWDLGFSQWFPDWYGFNNAATFIAALFASSAFPPGGSNFSFESDPAVDSLIQKALTTTSSAQAASFWAEADHQVMKDAPVYPINSPQFAMYVPTQVHNAVYVPQIEGIDQTNVWLSPSNRQSA